ncbi:MAG: hypothetical protein ACWGSQ_20370, partial [Longimicrobiales bacterium]
RHHENGRMQVGDRLLQPDVPAQYVLEVPGGFAKRHGLKLGSQVRIDPARNLPNVEVRPFGEESVYEILWANTVVIERSALEKADSTGTDQSEEEAADA